MSNAQNDDTARLDWLNTVQGMDWFADCDYSDATREAIDAARGVQPAAQYYNLPCDDCGAKHHPMAVCSKPAAQESAPAAEQKKWRNKLIVTIDREVHKAWPLLRGLFWPDAVLTDAIAKGVDAAPSPAREKPTPGPDMRATNAAIQIAHEISDKLAFYSRNSGPCGTVIAIAERAIEVQFLPSPAQEEPPQIKCDGLHEDTLNLVVRFAQALADKLKAAQEKYGYFGGWWESDWREDCQQELLRHLAKGDPRDVANYCAFLWHHGWPTVAAQEKPKTSVKDEWTEAIVASLMPNAYGVGIVDRQAVADAHNAVLTTASPEEKE